MKRNGLKVFRDIKFNFTKIWIYRENFIEEIFIVWKEILRYAFVR